MNFRILKYLLVYLTPLAVLRSILAEGWFTYYSVIVMFVWIPILEFFAKGSKKNLSKAEEEMALKDKMYDLLLYSLVPIQYLILFIFLFRVSEGNLQFYEKLGISISFGLSCGIVGINAAHELGHRTSWYEQFMSKMLLLTTLYMHFFIEHNRGHHKNVSTDEDPASSKLGEMVYTFYFRSIYGSFISAWKLEAERLRRVKFSFWSFKNEMIIFQLLQASLIVFIFYFFGLETTLFFMISATLGILLLETVNYIEHYGLRRKKKENGYERTLPIHSWNSNHPVGRMVLLELSRHSDHHYIASRKYQVLRHFDESPQMPTGYPGMLILSLFPPLWFSVMNPRIEKYRKSMEGNSLA
jgi:alkane 1-monooxygenase